MMVVTYTLNVVDVSENLDDDNIYINGIRAHNTLQCSDPLIP